MKEIFRLLLQTLLPIICIFIMENVKANSNNIYQSPCSSVHDIPYPLTYDKIYLQTVISYECLNFESEYISAMAYLRSNIPSFDLINKGTLGFIIPNKIESIGTDGLNQGIVNVGTNLSLSTKQMYPWSANLSKELFYEFVLPYGIVNEARNNWRPLMHNVANNILINSDRNINELKISDVVYIINSAIWYAFSNEIVFKSSQTPLIFDPMSIITFGYASCTGVSIFLVDALRSIGIPARIAGTPAWNQNIANGNHNWIEVYTEAQEWEFIEALPASGNDSKETLNNPCDKWFCNPANFANNTKVYASLFNQKNIIRYPLAWDLTNTAIPGLERTEYYQHVCNAC